MAKDVKRRFTISLDIETKDVEKQVKATVGNLKTILSDLGSASDKMPYFKELADYLSQIDSELDRFKKKHGDGMFAKVFGGLDSSLRQEMENIFGVTGDQLTKLDVLRTKLSELRLSGKVTAESLKPIEDEVKELYASIGKLDEAKISGRGALETRISKIYQALENFSIVFEDVRDKVSQGFGFGVGGDELQQQIKGLEKSIKKYNELIEDIEKLDKAKKNLDKMQVPKQFGTASTVNEVVDLLKTYQELQSTMKAMKGAGDTSSVKYYETLIEYAKVATKLYSSASSNRLMGQLEKFKFEDADLIKALGLDAARFKSDISDGFDLSGVLANLQTEIGTFFEGFTTQFSSNIAYVFANVVVDLERQIKQVKSDSLSGNQQGSSNSASGNTDTQIDQNQRLAISYEELSKKIQKYYDLSKQIAGLKPNSAEWEKVNNEMQAVSESLQSMVKEEDAGDISDILADMEFEGVSITETIEKLCTVLGVQIPASVNQASIKLQEFLDRVQQIRNLGSLDGVDLSTTISELEAAKDKLKQLADQGELTEQQMNDVAAAFDGAKVYLGSLQNRSEAPINEGTNRSSGNAPEEVTAHVDFSSLEDTIRTEAASLRQKFDSILKVEVVKDNAQEIQSAIDGIKATIDKISAAIDSYNLSKQASGQQAEIDTMKANLKQFLNFVSDFNAKKVNDRYQRQEIGAAILSDGSISTTYGEEGTVPWDRMASSLVGNLTKSLLVDVHSHPWSQFPNGHRIANDHFSGSYGDLGAFRLSKQLGAQLGAMITGNVMRVFDVSKLTDKQMLKFKTELKDIEKTYSKKPEYSQYMSYDEKSGKVNWKMQNSFTDMHKLNEAYESLMYKALERIGFSKDQIENEIFQKYNLTDDKQLTALAEKLVSLAHASQNALSPVERLSEIITQFGGNVNSAKAKEGLAAYQKGELSAAAVFNGVMKDANIDTRISQKTIESLLSIDTANEMPAVESLLTQIVGILSQIDSGVANINNNSRQRTSDQFDMAIHDILDLRDNIMNPQILSGIKSIFDPLNISKYQNQMVSQISDAAVLDANDYIRDLFIKAKDSGSVDADEMQIALNKFYLAMSNVQDAIKQIDLYEARTPDKAVDSNGQSIKDTLVDQYHELTSDSNLQALLYLLSQAKIDINKQKDFYKDGFGWNSNDDDEYNDSLTVHLQSIQSTLDSIYGVLHGFTGIDSTNGLGVEYKKPVQIEESFGRETLDDAHVNSLISSMSELQTSINGLDGSIKTLIAAGININNESPLKESVNDTANIHISDEINSLEQLRAKLIEVQNAIELKTQAFLNEGSVVSQSVSAEIAELKSLLDILQQIVVCVNSISSESVPKNIFDAWKTDLVEIENKIKEVLKAFGGVEASISKVSGDLSSRPVTGAPNNDYALDATLQQTNNILGSILSAVGENAPLGKLSESLNSAVAELKNVANGIVQHQRATNSDTSVANARISNARIHDQIRDVALNAVSGRVIDGGDSNVTNMTAMANGIVKVTGYVQTAEEAWEGFTLQVNEANEVSKIAYDINAKAAKDAARAAEILKNTQSGEDDNPVKFTPEETYKKALAEMRRLHEEGKNATLQYKDNGRFTITTKETIGGLARETFQTFDEFNENMSRTTVTMSNQIASAIQDANKLISESSDKVANTDLLTRYNSEYAKLIVMNGQYEAQGNLSDADIQTWNQQISLVQRLGTEISGLIKQQDKLENQAGVAKSARRLQEYHGQADKIFKGLDFGLNVENATPEQQSIINLYDKIIDKVELLQKTHAVLTDAQIQDINNLVSALKSEASAYAEKNKAEQAKDTHDTRKKILTPEQKVNKDLYGAEVKKYEGQINQAIKNLDFSLANKNLTDVKQKEIADLHRNVRSEIDKVSGAIKAGGQVELSSLEAAKNALIEKIKLYKQENNIIDSNNKKQSARYGRGVMTTAEAKNNELIKSIAGNGVLSSLGKTQGNALYDALEKYKKAYSDLADIQQQLQNKKDRTADDETKFKQASAACNNLRKDVENLVRAYDKLHNDPNKIDEYILDERVNDDFKAREKALRDYVASTYGAQAKIGEFKNGYRELLITIDNGDGTFTEAKASIDNLGTSIVTTATKTGTATSKFSAAFNALGAKTKELWTYAAARFGVDEIIQAVRQGIEYVREIDSALTELKKVTDETDATYDAFLQTMSKTGSVIGSTVSDLTTMAAEWARLGYSLEEAGMLAESTAILLNVSEFDDATEASEALISTMQAFQYTADESQHVVDILNEVGKFIAPR